VSNDQVGVRRLLQHYRSIANAATLDEAHLIEGYMAETWKPGTSNAAARRAEVTARGRSQAGS
jgi:enoyl-CoA hydratase